VSRREDSKLLLRAAAVDDRRSLPAGTSPISATISKTHQRNCAGKCYQALKPMEETRMHLEFVKNYIDAYNNMDWERIGSMVADDIHCEHHSRFKGHGKKWMLETMAKWAERAPGRRLGEITRWAENGDLFFWEHKWYAKLATDNETFEFTTGQEVEMELTTLFVIRNGLIVEMSDYG
jgi:hypothetical protein